MVEVLTYFNPNVLMDLVAEQVSQSITSSGYPANISIRQI